MHSLQLVPLRMKSLAFKTLRRQALNVQGVGAHPLGIRARRLKTVGGQPGAEVPSAGPAVAAAAASSPPPPPPAPRGRRRAHPAMPETAVTGRQQERRTGCDGIRTVRCGGQPHLPTVLLKSDAFIDECELRGSCRVVPST